MDDSSTGVMVALIPPLPVAEQLAALGSQPVAEIHVTLVYVGKTDGDPPVTPETLTALTDAVAAWAPDQVPISGVYNGRALFLPNPNDDGKAPSVALLDAPGITEMWTSLCGALDLAGISFSRDHSYTPHSTVDYLDPATAEVAPFAEPIEVTFSAVTVFVGPDQTEIPLGPTVAAGQPVAREHTMPIPRTRDELIAEFFAGRPMVAAGPLAPMPDQDPLMCCDGSGRTAAEHRAEDGHCCVDGGDTPMSHQLRHSYAQATADATLVLGDVPGWALISQEERDKAASSGAAMPDGCLSAETMVTTPDGPRTIGSMVGACTVLTDQGWRRAEVQSFGVKALRAVVLRSGDRERTVFATARHRWYLGDGRIVETDDLDSGCLVPEVRQDRRNANLLGPANHGVAAVAEQTPDTPGGVVVIDHERRPLTTCSGVAPSGCGLTVAESAQAALAAHESGELSIPDAVLPPENPFSAGEPAGIAYDNLVRAATRPVPDTELTIGSAVAVASRKVRVGTLDLADPADDGTDILNGLTGRAHRSEPIQCWRVVAVWATDRIEEVFCAVVPVLHRFVLADGILTGNSYPITTCDGENSVATAIKAVGRGSGSHNAIRKHIATRAKSLGCSSLLPDNWNADGSLKGDSSSATDPLAAAAPPLAQDNDVGIDPSDTCQNAGCEHPASAHGDAPLGDMTGACGTAGCTCTALAVAGDSLQTSDDGDGASGGAATVLPGPVEGDAGLDSGDAPELAEGEGGGASAPMAPGAIGASASFQDEGLAPGEIEGPAFTIPVAIVEGIPTGDGRQITPGALDWLPCPLPLMGLKTSAHDPSGMSANDPAYIIGRIDYIRRSADNANIIQAGGVLLTTEHGLEWAEIIGQMGRVGVSADVVDVESEISVTEDGIGEDDEFLEDMDVIETLTSGKIAALTCCPMPAFPSCYIVLGTEAPETAPTMTPTAAQAGMAYRIANAETCEPCAEGTTPALVAAGGPLAPPTAWFQDPAFTNGDPRLVELVDQKTGRPTGKYSCPITVTADGRVFGHLATWGVCHTDYLQRGRCITAPHSKTGYALFHSGSVLTAEGTIVDTGPLTVDGSHANLHMSLAAAQAHYDNSATRVANVRAGEDEYGIWVAGAIHPEASDAQVYTLRSTPLSGDWRPWGTSDELIAGHGVNTAGFPQPKATLRDGRVQSLVAAGVPCYAKPAATDGDRLTQLERAMAPLLPLAADGLRTQFAAARAE